MRRHSVVQTAISETRTSYEGPSEGLIYEDILSTMLVSNIVHLYT